VPASGAAQPRDARDGSYLPIDAVDDVSRDTVVQDFGSGTPPPGDDRRATGQGFNHDQTEGLRPFYREQQGSGAAKQPVSLAVADLADELDERL
jgi:hypothetical protein